LFDNAAFRTVDEVADNFTVEWVDKMLYRNWRLCFKTVVGTQLGCISLHWVWDSLR